MAGRRPDPALVARAEREVVRLRDFLRSRRVAHWPAVFDGILQALGEGRHRAACDAFSRIPGAGMGALWSDLHIHPVNGHRLFADEHRENARFMELSLRAMSAMSGLRSAL